MVIAKRATEIQSLVYDHFKIAPVELALDTSIIVP